MSSVRIPPTRASGLAAENVPIDIKTEIGELITQWSYVAFQLGVIVRVGFKLDKEVGFALLSTTNLQPLCGTLRTLAGSRKWVADADLRRKIKLLATDVQANKSRRNDFAHGVFGMVEGEDGNPILVRYCFKESAQGSPVLEHITIELLRSLADEAYNFGSRAQDITVELKAYRMLGN